MTACSYLYRGSVMHRRLRPKVHNFRYRAFWTLLDLDELPELASQLRLFSCNRFNLFALYDADHGDGSATPLRQQAERHLLRTGIDIAGGPIRLFCMPRTLGYSFNPLSVYFCHRPGGALAAIIYQVHNTFGERHAYVAPVDAGAGAIGHGCHKTFHVSPFLDMDMSYRFRLTRPDERFELGITAHQHGRTVLSACLAASRQTLSDAALLRNFAAMPFITAKVILAIHWEALRLWLKGLRLRARPQSAAHDITLAATSAKQRIDTHAL
ncbi:DUF1365 domain-containing protein [Bradyrhizobium jicamae]|uniref:DUF1365 domain-containing protein n=1 Tax=Bradyrhizobium jicamae TaxID=280332 RepID=A0ABS5FMJ6_9BRAD|nr:DUF1365 domain-containing protein [Bradyrhizobium jicamae]MBR0797551.1 DUF1365 domain-containing protein [Bradyrhizobium jicamae]